MKKVLLTVLALCIAGLSFAQRNSQWTYPDDADYKITGTLVMDNRGNLMLLNPQGHGINFAQQGVDIVGENQRPKGGSGYTFVFDRANTDCPGKFSNPIKFWTLEDDGVWRQRVEVKDGQKGKQMSKHMVIVFVMDCSKSMGNSFEQIRNTIISGIDQFAAQSYNGNIHVGVVAFSDKVQKFPIRPLTSTTASELRDSIRRIEQGYQTALYEAMDEATNMIESYVAENSAHCRFETSQLITFTDGSDNLSNDIARKLYTPEDFQAYLSNRLQGKCSDEFVSQMVALRGVEENGDVMRRVGNSLACQGKYDQFETMGQVIAKLNTIINELVQRWTTLNCNVPIYNNKQVCWVLECAEKPKPVAKVNPESCAIHEFGVIAGFVNGISYRHVSECSHWAFQADLGYSIYGSLYGGRIDQFGSFDDNTWTGVTTYHEYRYESFIYNPIEADFHLQYRFNPTSRFDAFAGFGANLGVTKRADITFGFNAIVGLGWRFNKLSAQFDFRPGFVFLSEYQDKWEYHGTSEARPLSYTGRECLGTNGYGAFGLNFSLRYHL